MKQAEKDLNYQLGEYVGQYIVDRFLPTTSVDMIKTRTVISTTIAEADKHKALTDVWFKSSREGNKGHTKEWIEMTDFYHDMTVKYLPHTLRCYIPRVKPTDIDKFMKGVIDALWDSDVCSYHLERELIEFIQDEYSTVINLKLQTEFEPWETKK